MSGRTVDVADRDAEDPGTLFWMKAPLAKRTSGSIVEDTMTNALYRVDVVDATVSPDIKRKNAAASEVTCSRFVRICRSWSESHIFLRGRNARQEQQRE